MKRTAQALCVLLLGFVCARPARPCSIFMAHDADRVLVGDNEDWYSEQVNPSYRPMIRFVPAGPGGYGYAIWGFEFAPDQGGMNDQGLFWDWLATPSHTVDATGTEPWTINTMDQLLQTCATVGEAIAFMQRHELSPMQKAQLMVVDRFGDAAIFEGSVTVWPTEDFQVGTNFLQSQPELGNWPCTRYDTLTSRLSSGFELTVDYFRDLAEAAHQRSASAVLYTRYTVIGELREGVFHLYFDLDWEHPRTFVLADALAEGPHADYMDDLFTPDAGVADAGVADAGTHDPDGGGGGCGGCRAAGTGAGGPTSDPGAISLVLMFLWLRRRRRVSPA